MTGFLGGGARVAALLLVTAMLAGCSTTGDDSGDIAANDQPQAAPVTDSSVSSSALPPIGGADGTVQTTSADPDATGALPPLGSPAPDTSQAAAMPSPAGSTASTGNTGSFVSLNDVGQVSGTPGRDLTGGLTVEKLLGGWTVNSGNMQCRLNLTYTSTSNGHYRASAPACQIPTLGSVAAWQLTGTQVQLFDGGSRMVGTLLLSGNMFIGTLSGGRAISMAG
jgi:Protease inhibitor Inh